MVNKYQLSILVENLKGGSVFRRRPVPYAQVTVTQGTSQEVIDLGRTETSPDPTISPDWCHCFKLEFDETILYRFEISIKDALGKEPSPSDPLLASAEFEATEVFQSPGHMQFKEAGKGAK